MRPRPSRSSFYENNSANQEPGNGVAENESLDLLLNAIRAVKNGDFSIRLPAHLKELATEFNSMVTMQENMCDELLHVNKDLQEQGNLNNQLNLGKVNGAWLEMETASNQIISSLTQPINEIDRVISAVAKGNLTTSIAMELQGSALKGDFYRIAKVVNDMVDQLNGFASEVTRVSKEVGTDGKLGGQAQVLGVAGTWKDLTDNVNQMANNLTGQVRNIAEVTTAVAQGDLSKKITVEAQGEIQELKETINIMVDQLNSFSGEVTRVAREVGTDGKLGGQARVEGVSGTWKNLTENVNQMASNLTGQVRNIAEVTLAVAKGDLTKKITVDAKGEIYQLKNTINNMVDQLNGFSGEVTRVAREVGTDGQLGGQAKVEGVAGTWKDLTDNVNQMANNLTGQVRNIAEVTTAVAQGDLSKKITVDAKGEIQELKSTINTMVDQLNGFAGEVTRVAREVGTDGQLGGQAEIEGVAGTWKDLTDNVNQMANNLTGQVRNIAEVTTAVALGDLSKKITVDANGEILELKRTINNMVGQLNGFSGEVTRVAREVGTDGQLGGQAKVEGVAGTWKDLTDNVNHMASNLTSQVRNIAEVTTAVAEGDLTKKITVEAQGEIQELKTTINTMVDQLNAFSSEVTRVAREVGVEGKLGGQAQVAGVAGVWKELTENVNVMAANVTSQVRDIAEMTETLTNSAKNFITVSDLMKKNAGETFEQANIVSQSADDVSNSIHTVATSTEELNSSIKEIASNANKAAEVATQAVKMTEETNVTVSKLGDSSSEIGNIVKVINSIAQQTNLLALNANIEAARAGEAGKGFAVVANEVKELAKKTSAATTDISEKIEAIQTDADGSVSAITNISEIINTIFDIQNTIASAVEQQSTTTNEIARTVDQTAKGASDIAKNISVVNEAASSTTEGANDTGKSALELSSLASNLEKLIGHFSY